MPLKASKWEKDVCIVMPIFGKIFGVVHMCKQNCISAYFVISAQGQIDFTMIVLFNVTKLV